MVKSLICVWLGLVAHAWAAEPVIALQPLGKVPAAEIESAKKGILSLYAAKVAILPVVPLPKSAYYPPRERYKADKLLDYLATRTPAEYVKVIGLTTSDISTQKDEHADWGIFGLGQLGGRACVVSTFRLRAGKAKEPVFLNRLVNVVNHELGHTFGRDHCPTAGCIMLDAGGKIATVDGETGKPCPDCAAKLPVKAPQ